MFDNNNDTKTIILKVNGNDAEKNLEKLNKSIEAAAKKKEDLDKKYANGEEWAKEDIKAYRALGKEIEKCERQIDRMDATAQQVNDTINNLDKASPKELQKTLRTLEKSLNKVKRGSNDWNELTDKIRQTKEEIKKVNDELQETDSMTDKFAAWGQKWMGIAEVFESTIEAFSGIKATASEATQAYAEMAEAEADVRKYTGLADEQVRELNDTFKKMDTRTTRDQLNGLAADAGRLGITAKEDIVQFVDAANMINVALGEDLGEGAVKNIGKLAQLFGDDQERGLKTAMLATGSVINELAQTSSANEGYLMDFTARLAGLGRQAGMSQAEIMGLASVMDQAMVNAEEGSTAISKVIQKIYREPAKMAKAAGMDVEKFTQLVKTDVNAALLEFAGAVSKMGGMEKIAPMLGDLSLTGAGVSKAISTLAAQVDKVRETQVQATEAFEKGDSVLQEYNAANNTVQAGMEKARKRVNDLKIELGEQLLPVMQSGLAMGSKMMMVASALLKFAGSHIRTMVTLAAAISTYVVLMNLAVIKTQALVVAQTAWKAITMGMQVLLVPFRLLVAGVASAYASVTASTRAATIAQNQFNLAIRKNPLGLFLSLLSVGIAYLVDYANRAKTASKEQQELNEQQQIQADIDRQVADSTKDKITEVKRLSKVINDNTTSVHLRREAIEKLKAIIPGYNGDLANEKKLTAETTSAVTKYIAELKKVARAKALLAKMEDIEGQVIVNEESLERRTTGLNVRQKRLADFDASHKGIKELSGRNAAGMTKEQYEMPFRELAKKSMIADGINDPNASDYDDVYRNRVAEIHKLLAERKALVEKIKEAEGWVAEQSGVIEKLNNKSSYLQGKINAAGGDAGSGDAGGNTGGGGGGGLGGGGDAGNSAAKRLEDEANQLKMIERLKYENGVTNREQYALAILQIDVNRFEKEKQLYKENSAEWISAENSRLDALAKIKKNGTDVSLHQIDVDMDTLRNETKKGYIAGELSEKEYQDNLNDIHLQGLQRRAEYLEKYAGGSHDAEAARQAYEDALLQDQLARKEQFLQKAKSFEDQYAKMSSEDKKKIELATLDELIKAGVIAAEKKEEYIQQIEERFKKGDKSASPLGGPADPLSQSVVNLGNAISNLQTKINAGKAGWQDYAAVATASLGSVMSLLNGASQLVQANIQIEQNKIERKYDAEIKAAGNNQAKIRKIEKKKEKEIAAMKNKQNKKAMAIQMAAAVAQTAVSAINAYASAAAIPVVGHIMAPIAAAAAVAAGMIQIAVIKKQQEAQSAGYYEGGYVGGNHYRREAGVVHEGEFVGNHYAVANPVIRRVFDTIDLAQRYNRVGSLRADDISRSINAPQQVAAAVSAPAAPVVVQESERTAQVLERLDKNLEEGIPAYVVIEGQNGLDQQMKKYNRMKNRK